MANVRIATLAKGAQRINQEKAEIKAALGTLKKALTAAAFMELKKAQSRTWSVEYQPTTILFVRDRRGVSLQCVTVLPSLEYRMLYGDHDITDGVGVEGISGDRIIDLYDALNRFIEKLIDQYPNDAINDLAVFIAAAER